jgi:hypothetical protein
MDMHPLTASVMYESAHGRQRDLRRSQDLEHAVPRRPSFPRRALARAFAALSLGSAWAVRRLDAPLADDLAEGLTAGRSA